MRQRLLVLVLAALLASCAGLMALGARSERAAPTPTPDARVYISVTTEPVIEARGEDASATVTVRNGDSVARVATLQAFFYRVPLSQLGDDPSQYLTTAGHAGIGLGPGEERSLTIAAKNFNRDPIVSGRVDVIGAR